MDTHHLFPWCWGLIFLNLLNAGCMKTALKCRPCETICVTEQLRSLCTGLICLLLLILMLWCLLSWSEGLNSDCSLIQDFWVRHLLLISTTTLAKVQHFSTLHGIWKATNLCLCKVLLASFWLGCLWWFLTYITSWSLVCFSHCIIGFIRKVQFTTGFEASKFQTKEENKMWDFEAITIPGLNFHSVLIPVMHLMQCRCCDSVIPREARKADLDYYLGNPAYFAVCKSVVLTIIRKKSIPWFKRRKVGEGKLVLIAPNFLSTPFFVFLI